MAPTSSLQRPASNAGAMGSNAGPPTAIKWVLDTRPLWPEASETADLVSAASRALALLAADEQAEVLRFYFVKDAKLALASALLKRLAVVRGAGGAWAAARCGRDERGKPVFRRPGDGAEPLLFNVSHQAGVVALAAVARPPPGAAVGIDVVCPAERRARDRALLAAAPDGWARFVGVHADALAPAEAARLCALPGGPDGRLAHFYALWCVREAYVKMTGHALLAPWLRDLDVRRAGPPGDADAPELWLRGARVDGVHVRLDWLLGDYMVCTAVRWGDGPAPDHGADMAQPFAHLALDDVLAEAEASLAGDGRA